MPRTVRKRGRKRHAQAINEHVGQRVKLRRNLLGLSQEELGAALGLTFQQIQKYEKGVNRVSAGTLFALSKILAVPVGYFFEDMPTGFDSEFINSPKGRRGFRALETGDRMLMSRKILNLARAFSRIPDDRLQENILQLVKATADRYEAAPC